MSTRIQAAVVALNVMVFAFCASWLIVTRSARPAATPAAPTAVHLSSGVVYVSTDGHKHAAICIGTADGEHWNLAVWMPSGETFIRFGIAEGQPDVPNTWHRSDAR